MVLCAPDTTILATGPACLLILRTRTDVLSLEAPRRREADEAKDQMPWRACARLYRRPPRLAPPNRRSSLRCLVWFTSWGHELRPVRQLEVLGEIEVGFLARSPLSAMSRISRAPSTSSPLSLWPAPCRRARPRLGGGRLGRGRAGSAFAAAAGSPLTSPVSSAGSAAARRVPGGSPRHGRRRVVEPSAIPPRWPPGRA